jgi:hypothetical protein
MQQWYRVWKEHYLDICLNIRKHFIDEVFLRNNEKLFPYWLRKETPPSKISIDNLFKYITLLMNFSLVYLISYQLVELNKDNCWIVPIVCIIIAIYIGRIYLAQHRIRKGKNLWA